MATRFDTEHMKEKISIVDAAIRGNVILHKKGANYFFKCPRHYETLGQLDANPSAYINHKENFFYCNSCGASGDMFDLVKGYNKYYNGKNMSFEDVCRTILSEESDPTEYIVESGTKGKSKSGKKNSPGKLETIPVSDTLLRFIGLNPEPKRIHLLTGAGDSSDVKDFNSLGETENGEILYSKHSEQVSIKNMFIEDKELFWSIVIPKALEKLAYIEKNKSIIPSVIEEYSELCDFICMVYREKGKQNKEYLEKAKKLQAHKEYEEYSNMFKIRPVSRTK